MDVEHALAEEQLETAAVVSDGPLPVLGTMPAADGLELVRGDPGAPELDAVALATLVQLGEVHHGLVLAALHL